MKPNLRREQILFYQLLKYCQKVKKVQTGENQPFDFIACSRSGKWFAASALSVTKKSWTKGRILAQGQHINNNMLKYHRLPYVCFFINPENELVTFQQVLKKDARLEANFNPEQALVMNPNNMESLFANL